MNFISPQQLLEKRIKTRKDQIWIDVQEVCILKGNHICLTETELIWFKEEIEPIINVHGWKLCAAEHKYENLPTYYFITLESIEGINVKPDEWRIII